ncbi:hypothetical protein QFZ37_002390 [Chryseobacterium ginsenosidimutans]|uniref:PH domain-containing protein n=1 Tax=Chryseobacterium ginsenosidimutans TaxID=687846 RepID=UPI0027863577|nr:PH domain-containing protein [Chryseobacterium ginsenosidimutans]MDQ0594021.1 hypothetical protein [Chryseobacterium ginsenosidimutans]
MSDHCGLCGAEFTSMDTMLGENKLSDGNILCNKCLEKASNINQELLYGLNNFSINDIKRLIENSKVRETGEISNENLPIVINSEQGLLSKDLYKKRLKEIKQQLDQLKANLSIFAKGEIKELPHILALDETILAITDAQFSKTVDAGILLATPKRIVSVSKAMFSPVKVNEYHNEDILEVSFVNSFLSPIIKIHTKDKIVEFESFLNKDYAEDFYNFIKKIYNKEESQKQSDEVKTVSSEALFGQLEKLAQLRENGILTEEEFAEQKKKLLEKL